MSNKPITRKEMFMAKASGQNVNTPKPITREEMFLERIAENVGETSCKDIIETVGCDTLTWDGNTEGLYSVMGAYYHVSAVAPTFEELQQGGTVTLSTNVSVSFDSTAVAQLGEVVFCILVEGAPIALVVLKDNALLEAGNTTMTIEKAGIYFLYDNTDGAFYVTSLTINGYTGFTKEQVKQEYLPSGGNGEPDLILEFVGLGDLYNMKNSQLSIAFGNIQDIYDKVENCESINAVIIGESVYGSYSPAKAVIKAVSAITAYGSVYLTFYYSIRDQIVMANVGINRTDGYISIQNTTM